MSIKSKLTDSIKAVKAFFPTIPAKLWAAVRSEWGRRISYTGLACAILLVGLFGSVLINTVLATALVITGVFVYNQKADDLQLPSWRRGALGTVVWVAAAYLAKAALAGGLVAHFVVVFGAFAVLIVGATKMVAFLEAEARKESLDD